MGGEKKYKVICSGELAPGQDIEDVKKRMSALFKMDVAKIALLLKQKGTVIKRDVDLETAKKYAAAIERTGAICVIEPPATAPEPAQKAEESKPEEEAAPTEPRVVVIQLMKKGEPRFSPQEIENLAGSSNGLVINNGSASEIAFDQISALATYAENGADPEKNRLMMFVSSTEQPFTCDIDNINYADFPVKVFPNSLASFRGFLYFLCRRNPAIILEETTFDFLSGSTPQKMDEDGVLKLATGIGNLIESGNIASQT